MHTKGQSNQEQSPDNGLANSSEKRFAMVRQQRTAVCSTDNRSRNPDGPLAQFASHVRAPPKNSSLDFLRHGKIARSCVCSPPPVALIRECTNGGSSRRKHAKLQSYCIHPVPRLCHHSCGVQMLCQIPVGSQRESAISLSDTLRSETLARTAFRKTDEPRLSWVATKSPHRPADPPFQRPGDRRLKIRHSAGGVAAFSFNSLDYETAVSSVFFLPLLLPHTLNVPISTVSVVPGSGYLPLSLL